jgi:hypothetical protein
MLDDLIGIKADLIDFIPSERGKRDNIIVEFLS